MITSDNVICINNDAQMESVNILISNVAAFLYHSLSLHDKKTSTYPIYWSKKYLYY